MGRKLTTKQFIDKANEIHGDRYNYELSDYINSRTELTIICKEHGSFQLKPSKHLSGRGCQECGYEIMKNHKRDTKEIFVEKSIKAHGNLYDYSKVEYKSTFDNVTIICPVHGEFLQLPNHHVKGRGCWKCSGKNPLTTEDFIKRAKYVHGDRYDYSIARYINTKSCEDIICKEHGVFSPRSNDHLNGHGCPKCGIESRVRILNDTKESFIVKAVEAHGSKYDYSKVNYIKSDTDVDIICPIHGVFPQRPNVHTRGGGCSKCVVREGAYNITKAKRHKEEWSNKKSYIYVIEFKSENENFIKIGISNNPKSRLSKLKKVSECKVIDIFTIKTNLYDAIMAEQTFLKVNKKMKYTPLIKFHGHTECFVIEEKDNIINYFKSKL